MKLLLVQHILPDYRVPVFQALCTRYGDDFQLAAGSDNNKEGFSTGSLPPQHLVKLKRRSLAKGRLEFQTGFWREAMAADVVIFEMNPRYISTWLLILGRKLRRRPNVVWGHAWSREGSGSRSDSIRGALRKLGDVVMVYTESQARELKEKMPASKAIVAAPNALYTREQVLANVQKEGATVRDSFIFVGRLVAPKKPVLLLEAFAAALPKMGPEAKLIIVGDGPERQRLQRKVKEWGLEGRVILPGHLSSLDALRPLYEKSIASVSPGYVGLSITQSFAFGVPMIIARDEPHAPEIEAAVEGKNCVFFKEDSVDALATTLAEIWRDRETWTQSQPAIVEHCADSYSIELMTSRMAEAVRLAASLSPVTRGKVA